MYEMIWLFMGQYWEKLGNFLFLHLVTRNIAIMVRVGPVMDIKFKVYSTPRSCLIHCTLCRKVGR